MSSTTCRNLVLVLGDQLDAESSAFDGFDRSHDIVWMAENVEEATHVPCHKVRLVAFFASMRHFRDELRNGGMQVAYHALTTDANADIGKCFEEILEKAVEHYSPTRLIVMEPGDYRVQQQLRGVAQRLGVPLEERENTRFYCSHQRFAQWCKGRKQWIMEQFYRVMRQEHRVLLQPNGQPEGDTWNYDSENRAPFDRRKGPQIPAPFPAFPPDSLTTEVIEMVNDRFADHPGTLERFDLPVTRRDALVLLEDFLRNRLADFGKFQDAMWKGSDFLYHSRLSHAINVGLLNPREVVDGAVEHYRKGEVPLSSCEGFVRQILGWREYVRGVYWARMPEYLHQNALDCDPEQDVPQFFWDGNTQMACVADAMRLVLQTAYAHHIQRLMVLGLFAQLYGVSPYHFHQWHLAMYADAIDWVSAPNTIGMSQFGDGGLMATKPYCASGNYIHRMSNYCGGCKYDPKKAVGSDACPFTTLYWDFLDRHEASLQKNHRMRMQLKNLSRKSTEEMEGIRRQAEELRSGNRTI